MQKRSLTVFAAYIQKKTSDYNTNGSKKWCKIMRYIHFLAKDLFVNDVNSTIKASQNGAKPIGVYILFAKDLHMSEKSSTFAGGLCFRVFDIWCCCLCWREFSAPARSDMTYMKRATP